MGRETTEPIRSVSLSLGKLWGRERTLLICRFADPKHDNVQLCDDGGASMLEGLSASERLDVLERLMRIAIDPIEEVIGSLSPDGMYYGSEIVARLGDGGAHARGQEPEDD